MVPRDGPAPEKKGTPRCRPKPSGCQRAWPGSHAACGVYGARYATKGLGGDVGDSHLAGLVAAATIAAFAGSFIAARLLHKVTIHALQTLVGALLILVGVALAAGLI